MVARSTTAKGKAAASKAVETVADKPSRVLAKLPGGGDLGFNPDGFTDYDAALAVMDAAAYEVPTLAGERLVECKDLVGVPLIVTASNVIQSDKYSDADGNPATFVAVTAVAKGMGKVVFATGAYGIVKKVNEAIALGVPMFHVPDGLTVSEFPTVDKSGAKITATSYWFSGS